MAGGPQRQVFRFPSYQAGFRGLLDREGVTDEAFQGGFLAACTNFHLIGRGRLRKRRGHGRYVTALPNGASYIQGVAMYEFSATRHLITVANGQIRVLNGSTWDNNTGTLTLTGGQNNLVRFTQFAQGAEGSFIIGTGPSMNRLWKWSGSGAATLLIPTTSPGPLYATDIEEFYGRLWACGTDSGNTAVVYTEDGLMADWPAANAFHASRSSPAMALKRHNDGTMLIFHQRSVHRIEPVYDTAFGDPFARYLVDDTVGAESTYSVVNSKGVTYFASKQGFHRIRDPRRPAEYISWPIEDYWAGLNQARTSYIFGFERGEPWNEVVWLVSTGSSTVHNAAIVYNTELNAWTVFEGALDFNCGCNFVNSSGKEITILGGNDGIISQAWGDENLETGNVDGLNDDRAVVKTTFKTGAMEWGYPGLKRHREMWLDMKIDDTKTFDFTLRGIAGSPTLTKAQDIGAAGATFGSFVFGTSAFAGSSPTQAKVSANAKARLFEFTMTESDDGAPFTLNALRFWWRPAGKRIKAAA